MRFKIQHKISGLYSLCDSDKPQFNSTGFGFSNKKSAELHFKVFLDNNNNKFYKDCEVVEVN